MFGEIYPRSLQDIRSSHSVLGLFEELGEMAEAIRVFDRHPKYFIGEAADVFSYLMGLANEYGLKQQQMGRDFSLEDEFIKRYPGLCVQCGHVVCVCPMVPESTVGRLAKELEIDNVEQIFSLEPEAFRRESVGIASRVLAKAGGWTGLIEQFPFDRGDTNKSLVLFCIQCAELMDKYGNTQSAESLRSAAVQIGAAATYPGSRKSPAAIGPIVDFVKEIIKELPVEVQRELGIAGQSLEMTVGKASGFFREPEFYEPDKR
jgi:NTP pyrophosphatase (non-canonical NTP hydrolase)